MGKTKGDAESGLGGGTPELGSAMLSLRRSAVRSSRAFAHVNVRSHCGVMNIEEVERNESSNFQNSMGCFATYLRKISFLNNGGTAQGWRTHAGMLVDSRAQGCEGERRHLAFLALAFREFNVSWANVMDRRSFAMALESLMLPLEEIDQIFDEIDENGDGDIQLHEWIDNLPANVIAKLYKHSKADAWERETEILWRNSEWRSGYEVNQFPSAKS